MTLPTHIVAGLIVGKLSGHYGIAIAGAVLIDVDHLYVYAREGIFKKPNAIWKAMFDREDPYHGQRSFLHTTWSFGGISLLAYVLFPGIALPLLGGYSSHLLLDGIDASDFWPLRPLSNWNLRGPIAYRSYSELVLFLGLTMIFLILMVIK